MRLGLSLAITQPRGSGGAFDPSSVAGLVVWYDLAQGITESGGLATSWVPRVGSGDANKTVTAAGAARPTYTAADVNYDNTPTLTNDSNTEYMEGAGAWAAAQAQPLTVYCAGEMEVVGSRLFDGDGVGRCALINNGGLASLYAGLAFVDGAGTTPASKHVYACVFNGASSAIYEDDSAAAKGTGNPGAQSINRLVIGAFSGGAGLATWTLGGGLLVYSGAHDAATRFQIMQYLGDLVGVTVT